VCFGRFQRVLCDPSKRPATVTPDTLTSYRPWIIAVVTSNNAALCELSCNLTTLCQFRGLCEVKWHDVSGSLVAQGKRCQCNGVPGHDAVLLGTQGVNRYLHPCSGRIKVKVRSLSLPWRRMEGKEIYLHSFLTSLLDGGEWLTSRSGQFAAWIRTPDLPIRSTGV